MSNLEWCLKKLNEVAQDLREPQRGALLEHQAAKLDEVREKLKEYDLYSYDSLLDELSATLNRHSAENGSNTPDFILASFLSDCLSAWDRSVSARDSWYGIAPSPGSDTPDIAPQVHGGGTGED